jgi:hypothetical protein
MGFTADQIVQTICSSLAASPNKDIYIQMADEITSTSIFGSNRARAVALRAAHMFTLDSRLNGEAGAIQSETEGRLSVSYSIGSSNRVEDLQQTHYGIQLRGLIHSSSLAIRVAGE